MTFLTLDIETVPQARFVDPDCYWLRKDPHVGFEIEDDWTGWYCEDMPGEIRAGRAELKATDCYPSLHATTCHIVQVSFGWREKGNLGSDVFQSDDCMPGGRWNIMNAACSIVDAEKIILNRTFGLLASATKKGSVLVTFNGKGFDLPILRARAALLRLEMPKLPWRRLLYPYSDEKHADLRLILGNDDRRARGTLQWWAEAFGIHAEEHGAEVWGWVQAGEWDKLRAYGQAEAQTLVELYEAVGPVL